MSKVQTRRSISVRGETRDKLRTIAEQRGVSMSQIVEAWIAELPEPEAPTLMETLTGGGR